VALLLAAGPGRAATVALSELSSDATPPELLGGAIDFSVSGDTLTLTVWNFTSFIKHYEVDRAAFNVRSNVTGLALFPGDWRFSGSTHPPVFGQFDYAVEPRPGIDPLYPQGSITMVFTIQGTGPFSDADFSEAASVPITGETSARAALSFIHGPAGDSAWGAAAAGPLTGPLCLRLDGPAWPASLRIGRGACEPGLPTAAGHDVIRGRVCLLGHSADATSTELGGVECLADDVALDRFDELSSDDNPCAGGWFFLVRQNGEADYGTSFPAGLPEVPTAGGCP
jgi:hypothetical protein